MQLKSISKVLFNIFLNFIARAAIMNNPLAPSIDPD